MPKRRRPQINFQVDPPLKMLYEEAREAGHWVTRLCAAGFLLMVENPRVRRQAINRLREWEADFDRADPERIHAFVSGAEDAMTGALRGSRPGRKARPAKKKAKRSGS